MLRTLMLLALIVWIGGIIFFAFAAAPALFTILPAHLAADVVGPSLTRLHWMGLVAGAVFLICSLALNRAGYSRLRWFNAAHVLIALMLILTAISQFAITPRMSTLRSGPSGLAATGARSEFDRLHAWSTRTEGAVLLMGLLVVVLTARKEAIGDGQ